MRKLLKRHPHSRSFADAQIAVEVTRPNAYGLTLSYIVTGDISKFCVPPAVEPTRSDELWRQTCFEAFVRASGAEYYEFNFAPTTQWAAYQFSEYRSEKCMAEIGAPAIVVQSDPNRYTLETSLQLDSLSGLSGQASWHLGLSAVIVDTSGRISYWALAHPSGRPDFHHPDSFAYELFPTVQA